MLLHSNPFLRRNKLKSRDLNLFLPPHISKNKINPKFPPSSHATFLLRLRKYPLVPALHQASAFITLPFQTPFSKTPTQHTNFTQFSETSHPAYQLSSLFTAYYMLKNRITYRTGIYLKSIGIYLKSTGIYLKSTGIYPKSIGIYLKSAYAHPKICLRTT